MANIVKTKVAVSTVSVLILVLVPLLESSFMKPVVMKRWSNLTWDDFQGIPKPWSTYDAGINSRIFLEYDSALKRYHAYAAQNNILSWVKGYNSNNKDHEQLLTHEQYHFNITEHLARAIDKSILENVDDEQYLHIMRVRNGNNDLSKMQDAYDAETVHGTRLHRQKHWEFKIDSLLAADKGWLTDNFSGASIYLPNRSDSVLKTWVTPNVSRARDYRIFAYGINFSLISMQYPGGYDDSVIFQVVKNSKELSNAELQNIDSPTHPGKADFFAKDSTGQRQYFSWIRHGLRLYRVAAEFYEVQGDTAGYYEIAKSVINSFRVIDTDSTWVSAKESEVADVSSIGKNVPETNADSVACLVRQEIKPVGFVTNTIFFSDGGIQFSCDFSATADSLRFEDFVAIGRKDYLSYRPKKAGQVFYIDAAHLKDAKEVEIGYLLKEDTAKKCFRMFREIIPLKMAK